jgi:ADP-heptose:LPS heptosyltransferase
MSEDLKSILVVRTDKIGDVVLTTPAIAALRKRYPTARITGVVSSVASEIYHSNPHLTGHIVLDPAIFSGFLGFWRLVRRLRAEKADAAIVFQASMKVGFAVLLSGARYRIGPLSKIWSWLCYNYGRRQNRSAVEMHEADYNIQLLRELGITVADTWEKTYLTVGTEAKLEATRFFFENGFSRRFKTVVIHPGMAGSALNWPESHYIALGRRLVRRYNVLVSGGPGEGVLVDRIFQGIARQQVYSPDSPAFAKFLGEKGLAELIALLDHCDGVVAPSTGPMHLSVALGKVVVTIFPPIKVQSSVRWGPYGVAVGTSLGIESEDKASVLVPDVNCGENFRCALSACIYYPCMPKVSVDDVEAQLLALLEGETITMARGRGFGPQEPDEIYEENE